MPSTDSPIHRTHASVFACLVPGELVIHVLGHPWEVPLSLVPPESRLPNSLLWVTWRSGEILRIEPRRADDDSPMS
jgi:hypothetical protein